MVESTNNNEQQVSLGMDLLTAIPRGVFGIAVGAVGSLALPILIPYQINAIRENAVRNVGDLFMHAGVVLGEAAGVAYGAHLVATSPSEPTSYIIPAANVVAGIGAVCLKIYEAGRKDGSGGLGNIVA